MSRKNLFIIHAALILAFAATNFTPVNAKQPVRTVVTQRGTQSLASFFKASIGRYPNEVHLLEQPAAKARLINLVSQRRYNVMVENSNVVTPIEFQYGNFYTHACKAHDCGSTNFIISYNMNDNNLCVKYCEDGHEQIFKEKKSNAIWDY